MAVWIQLGAIGQLVPALRAAVVRVEKLYRTYQSDLYITSLQEGFHGTGSLHYDGRAVDIKRLFVPIVHVRSICPEEEGFYIIENESPSDTFHIEYRR